MLGCRHTTLVTIIYVTPVTQCSSRCDNPKGRTKERKRGVVAIEISSLAIPLWQGYPAVALICRLCEPSCSDAEQHLATRAAAMRPWQAEVAICIRIERRIRYEDGRVKHRSGRAGDGGGACVRRNDSHIWAPTISTYPVEESEIVPCLPSQDSHNRPVVVPPG